LGFELEQAGIPLLGQVGIPVFYKGTQIPLGLRAHLLVADAAILEIKAVPALLPTHEAQLLTYLRMSSLPFGVADELPRDAPLRRPQALCHVVSRSLSGPSRPFGCLRV
jgi:hypothetical protein